MIIAAAGKAAQDVYKRQVGKISLRTVAEIAEKVGKYGIVRINAVDEKFNALDSIGELILHRFIAG